MALAPKSGPGRKLQQHTVAWLRKAGLLPLAEWARFKVVARRHREENADFLKENPGFVPPPLALMHDAYNSVSYSGYMHSGAVEAGAVASLIQAHHPGARRVLEWGCGPARVIRHLPGLLPGAEFWGVDYNPGSIGWCARTLPGIAFAVCGLAPPLPTKEKFDVIYAISVLTHLSVEQQDAWVRELKGALNPGGILIMTLHGERCFWALLPAERRELEEKGVLVRAGVEEGKRCYTSYHTPRYAREHLFAGLALRQHIAHNPSPHTLQDIWVVQNGQ